MSMGKWRAGVFLLLLTLGSAAAQFDTPWEGYDTVAVGIKLEISILTSQYAEI